MAAPPSKVQDPLEPLMSLLRQGSAPPLVYLAGKERFLIDRAVEAVKAVVLDGPTRDFNYDALVAKEAGAQKIQACARTLPMMAKRRLVLVREADELSADELSALSRYVENPSAETCLCFVAEKVDLRLKFFTAFKKHGLLIKVEPLTERQLPALLRARPSASRLPWSRGPQHGYPRKLVPTWASSSMRWCDCLAMWRQAARFGSQTLKRS
jgi:DNA polymerase III delta subunit